MPCVDQFCLRVFIHCILHGQTVTLVSYARLVSKARVFPVTEYSVSGCPARVSGVDCRTHVQWLVNRFHMHQTPAAAEVVRHTRRPMRPSSEACIAVRYWVFGFGCLFITDMHNAGQSLCGFGRSRVHTYKILCVSYLSYTHQGHHQLLVCVTREQHGLM